MVEITRDAVSLSRPPASETLRHLPKPHDMPKAASETINLKTLARLVLARDSHQDAGLGGTRVDLGVLGRLKAPVSGVLDVSGVSTTTLSWSDIEEERAAIVEYDGRAPRLWAEALARLDPARAPCDVSPKRWVCFIDDCGRFLDEGWAERAEALGWGPLDLFGCDRLKPIARLDRAGLLWLIDGRRLLALTADTAAIATASGGSLTFRRSRNEPGRFLAWELDP